MHKFTQVDEGLNACVFTFHESLLDELRSVYSTALAGGLQEPANADLLAGGKPAWNAWKRGSHDFLIVSYGSSPLLWVSSNDLETYGLFKRFFDALEIEEAIKQLVDFERDIVMYCGFFVVGNHLKEPLWHVDYREGANAYSLITPLFPLDEGHGGLLYRDQHSVIRRYRYEQNEALILGDGFLHSTEPYEGDGSLRVLVSLTFGTDKLAHWGQLKQTIGAQSEFLMLPCGHPRGTCNCLPDAGRALGRPHALSL